MYYRQGESNGTVPGLRIPITTYAANTETYIRVRVRHTPQ